MNAVRPVARNLKIAVKIAKTGGVSCLYKLSLSRHNDSGSKVGQGGLKCGNLPQREGI
jgi:hypothetical protein